MHEHWHVAHHNTIRSPPSSARPLKLSLLGSNLLHCNTCAPKSCGNLVRVTGHCYLVNFSHLWEWKPKVSTPTYRFKLKPKTTFGSEPRKYPSKPACSRLKQYDILEIDIQTYPPKPAHSSPEQKPPLQAEPIYPPNPRVQKWHVILQ